MENSYLNAAKADEGSPSGPGLELIPLRISDIPVYLETGREAYREHYCHLWPGGDPDPYLRRNFTEAILRKELAEAGTLLWLIRYGGRSAGICKLDLAKPCKYSRPGSAVFLEKIYFRGQFTGLGLGTAVIKEIAARARKRGRTFLWLEAMQKGPALAFYQKNGFEILDATRNPYPEVLDAEKDMWVLGRPIL